MKSIGRLPLILALPAALGACFDPPGGDKKSSSSVAGPLLASQPVGAAGGTVGIVDIASPFYGVKVVIPPGALASTTTITITNVTGTGSLPAGMHDLEFGPAGLVFALPVTVTINYSLQYVTDFLITDATRLRVVQRSEADDPEILPTLSQDAVLRTISVQATHFSRFAAVLFSFAANSSGEHYRLVAQKRMLATQVHQVTTAGDDFVVSSAQPGATPVTVGQGSIAGLFASAGNLILVHSTSDDARNFVGANGLVDGLAARYANIAVYQYKSGRPIAENGNWLYNEIKRNAAGGFKTDLLGYSLGGIVARYAIERSKDDPARAALPNYDAATCTGPLDGLVRNFITLGSPHGGAVDDVILSWVEPTGALTLPVVANYFPGLTDNAQTGGTASQLNAAYADNGARYFLVAGASRDGGLSPLIPGDDDRLVAVTSATGVPVLNVPEESKVFPPAGNGGFIFSHSNLQSEAVPNGVRDQIVAWISIP